MRRTRKVTSFLLILVLIIGLVPVPNGGDYIVFAEEASEKPTSGTCGDNIHWEITEDTVAGWDLAQSVPYQLTLTGSGKMDFGTGKAPWYEHGYSPTITSISMEEGITTIPNGAFYECASLKSITLPDSVTSIGASAISKCSLLETVNCGAGLKSIGAQAFLENPSLTSVRLQEGVETIERYAFGKCLKLKNIVLPDSVKTLGESCFSGTPLVSLKIPKNTETIERNLVFDDRALERIQVSDENTHFMAVDNVLYELRDGVPFRAICYAPASASNTVNIEEGTEQIERVAFAYANNITTLSLPSTLKKITENAFFWCENIQELHIPDSVQSIENQAFAGCGLTKITVGKGLKELSGAIFQSCQNVKEVSISKENPYMEVIDNVVYNKAHTILHYYAPAKQETEYHVLDTVEYLDSYCIMKCDALRELYLPETLISLESGALTWNEGLNSIYFRGNAPSLGFVSINSNLQNLLIYRIPGTSGWDGSNWSEFHLVDWDPNNIAEDSGSFDGVTWEFQGSDGSMRFTGSGVIPDFSEEEPAPWNAYQSQIQTIEMEGITEIGNYAFYDAQNLIRVESDANLKRIGSHAFADCEKLVYAEIEDVETIEIAAFQNAASIQGKLNLKEVTSIGAKAFEGCISLYDVIVSSDIQSIEESSFAGCTSLVQFMIPDSVSIIKASAFAGSGLRTINIPANVHTIEAEAFQGNEFLENAYFYGSIPENWAEDSFADCDNLTICYRKNQAQWENLGEFWQEIPLLGLDKFYTEQQDHYSFDNSAASFGYPAGYRIPRQRHVDILDSIVLGSYYYAISGIWTGSCFGLAGSTLEFYENEDFQVQDYMESAENLYDLAAPKDKNAPLTKLIEAYQISQNKEEIVGCGGILSHNMGKYMEMVQKVEEFERSGGLEVDSEAEPIVLALYSKYQAHAVIPVSVKYDADGNYQMKVYDPNEPSKLQNLTINKNLKEISYKFYSYASYLDYSVISEVLSDIELHNEMEEESMYLSVDKEDVTITTPDGTGIEEVDGAYEQKLFRSEKEDIFSGIRSFVLPKGNYQIAFPQTDTSSKSEEDVTIYVASEDNFAEITSSDEETVLEVKQEETTEDQVEFCLSSESDQEETTRLNLMNAQGMERTVEVDSSNVVVTLKQDETIVVQVQDDVKVSLDGEELDVVDGQATGSFEVEEEENPLKPGEAEFNIVRDDKNKLNGEIVVEAISGAADDKNVTMTVNFEDETGKNVAVYSQEAVLTPGRNVVTLTLEEVDTLIAQTEEPVELTYRIEMEDENGNSLTYPEGIVIVSLRKPGTENPDPGPVDPDPGPGPIDPDPGPVDPEVDVEQVTVNPQFITLGAGEYFQLEASVLPENATDKTIIYIALNNRVQVSNDGRILAKKAGSSYVLVESANRKRQVVTVEVKNAPGTISLNGTKKKLEPGKSFQIKPVLPTGTASNVISYVSSNESVASVSSTGKVTAGNEGSAVITVQTFNGKKAELKITVAKNIPVEKVKLPVTKLTLGVGEPYALKAEILPKNASNQKLSYGTSNNKVKVTSNEKITAKKTGSCKVTVKASNGKKAVVSVTIKKAPGKITLNSEQKTLKVGKKFQIKITLPKNTASNKISYSSNKKSVASVSSSGKVTAKKKGTAIITVKTFNGKKAKLNIIVK